MSTPQQSGELTLKQGGIMLLVIGAGIIGAELATTGDWVWRGIPVMYIGGVFAALGALVTLIGIVKRS